MLKSQQLFIQNKFKIVDGYVTKITMEDLYVAEEKEIYLDIPLTKIINIELIESISNKLSYVKVYFEGEMNRNSIVLSCPYSELYKIEEMNIGFVYSEKPQLIKLTKNQCAKLRDKLFIRLKKQQY